MNTGVETPTGSSSVETVALVFDPCRFDVTYREVLDAILTDCRERARDDIFATIDELPGAEAIDCLRSRRDDSGRFWAIGRELEHGRADIPTDLLDEIEKAAGFYAEQLGDNLTSLGGMSWDDCQHFDPEELTIQIYAIHDVLVKLKRLQFEVERGINATVVN